MFDTRDLSQPLIKKRLDDYAGVPFPFYDEDSRLVYIAGKGESAISFFQYNPESPNLIDYLHAFKGKEPQKGFSMMPKRFLDVMTCEVMKGVRLTAKTIEYVSFKVPRKSGTFQADLYPPCRGPLPAQKFEEYWSGVDKEPVRIELKPGANHQDIVTVERRSTFMAKLGAKDAAGGTSLHSQAQGKSSAAEDLASFEIDALTQKVQQLTDQLNLSIQEVSELKATVEVLQ